jgi:hypothetical protein
MFIIVKHLPSKITADELHQFIDPALPGKWYQKTATLSSLKIVALHDKEGKIVERHGLVRISPDSAKARLIKALHRKSLGTENPAVSEYLIRHWSNDSNAHYRDMIERRRPWLRMHTLAEKLDF